MVTTATAPIIGGGKLARSVITPADARPEQIPGTEREIHPDDRRQVADAILAGHLASGPALNWSWRALPTVNEHRSCLTCREPWPCAYVRWARTVKAEDLATWSL